MNPFTFTTSFILVIATTAFAGVSDRAQLIGYETFAEARAASAMKSPGEVYIAGAERPGDGGGGLFYSDNEDSNSADDGGIILVRHDGTRLKRAISDTRVNVRWFGAKGDGVTDDTLAIQAGWAHCTSGHSGMASLTGMTPPALYFPYGRYVYRGAPLRTDRTTKSFQIIGDGIPGAEIDVLNNDYLIESRDINNLLISGLQFVGGKGVLKVNNPSSNVRGQYLITRCTFLDYTECAIGSLSSDMPSWRITMNTFMGSTSWGEIGVALDGLSDNSIIANNRFYRNLYGIKISGGYNTYIRNNDFIRYSMHSTPTADIWIVPTSSADEGLIIAENKFGNENLRPDDYRILIAAEKQGGTYLESHHSETVTGASLGQVAVRDNSFAFCSGYQHGVITTFTSDLRSFRVSNFYRGSHPKYVIEFPAGFIPTRLNAELLYDASGDYDSTDAPAPEAATAPIGVSIDPFGYLAGTASDIPFFRNGDDPSYAPIADIGDVIHHLAGSVAIASTNETVDPGAALLTWGRASQYAIMPFQVPLKDKPVWLELDIKRAPANTLHNILVQVLPEGRSVAVFQRWIRIPIDWQKVRFLWIPSSSGLYHLKFINQSDMPRTAFELGRIRIYQAHEPVSSGVMHANRIELSDPANSSTSSPSNASIYFDSESNTMRVRLPNGTTRVIQTREP